MKVFRYFILFLKQLFFFVIYGLSFLFPRNKKIWLYGCLHGTFRDNSKYLYFYASDHNKEVKHVWITPSKDDVRKLNSLGYTAVYKRSLSALYYVLTAKVYIYNIYASTDIFKSYLRGSAFLFNLWHGVPFKKIEYNVKTGPLQPYYNPKNLKEKFQSFIKEPKTFRLSSAVLATSEKLRDIHSSSFLVSKDKVFVGPYPRNLIFKWSKTELVDYINKVESRELQNVLKSLKRFKKVLIYLPTFRDANPDFMNEAIPDFDRLEEICKATNSLFLIKSHILTIFSGDVNKYTNIKILDSREDIYPLLPFTNALVSDYSSVIFDYSLLKKKIIFYAFDKEDYLSKSREAYFSYDEVFTDNITADFTELCHEIEVFGNENKEGKQQYNYTLIESFLENKREMKDIVTFIKSSINF